MHRFDWFFKIFLFLVSAMLCPFPLLGMPCSQYEGVYGRRFSSAACTPCTCSCILEVTPVAWQAREEGLNFALKNEPLPLGANVSVNGILVGPDFHWEPALKIKGGLLFNERAWDFAVQWTYFHTRTTRQERQATNALGAGLMPIWAPPDANIAEEFTYGSVKAHWNHTLQEFDIMLGYEPYISPRFSMRWAAGLKTVDISEHFSILYTEGFHGDIAQLIFSHTDLIKKTIGAGPRIEITSKWRLTHGFALLTSLAGSLPLWHYRITRQDQALGVLSTRNQEISASSRERFWTFRPVLEMLLGIHWEICFSQYSFGIAANYEFQYFSENNMFHLLVNPGLLSLHYFPRGDLQLQGVGVNIHFGF